MHQKIGRCGCVRCDRTCVRKKWVEVIRFYVNVAIYYYEEIVSSLVCGLDESVCEGDA